MAITLEYIERLKSDLAWHMCWPHDGNSKSRSHYRISSMSYLTITTSAIWSGYDKEKFGTKIEFLFRIAKLGSVSHSMPNTFGSIFISSDEVREVIQREYWNNLRSSIKNKKESRNVGC